MNTLIDEEPVFSAFNFGHKLKVTAPSFSKKINDGFDEIETQIIKEDATDTDESDFINAIGETKVDLNSLSFEEMFLIQAKKAQEEYFTKLASFELIILKQTIAKFIISPEFRTFSIKMQTIIKSLPDNIQKAQENIGSFSKEDEAKFLKFLNNQNENLKNNKAVPQKLKECNITIFKAVQADYLLKYND